MEGSDRFWLEVGTGGMGILDQHLVLGCYYVYACMHLFFRVCLHRLICVGAGVTFYLSLQQTPIFKNIDEQ